MLCFIAAVVATTVDGSCVGGWQSNFGYEYCVESTEETQATARSICHSRDAELASITSDAECDYVAGLMSVLSMMRINPINESYSVKLMSIGR